MELNKEGCYSVQACTHWSQSSKENQDSCLNREWSFLIPCPLSGTSEVDTFEACEMRFPNCCFPQA